MSGIQREIKHGLSASQKTRKELSIAERMGDTRIMPIIQCIYWSIDIVVTGAPKPLVRESCIQHVHVLNDVIAGVVCIGALVRSSILRCTAGTSWPK